MPRALQSIVFNPHPGPQAEFFKSTADIVIYGGEAGGGKTTALLWEPFRHLTNPDFGAVIFRRTSPQITNQGGLWDESKKVYPFLNGKPTQNPFTWAFPSGAKITFRHLQYDTDALDWLGSQIPLLEFDQLESFTKAQFFDLLARNRSTCGVNPYCRASCNPEPDHWLGDFLRWWIDEKGDPIDERCGKIRYFANVSDGFDFSDKAETLKAKYPDLFPANLQPLSLTFIHAKLSDNPTLEEADPAYRAKLNSLPYAKRRALAEGNWKTRPQGKLFLFDWFRWCEKKDVPSLAACVTGVDPSGGHGENNDEQGIVAVGKGADGMFYVLADDTCKLSPRGWGTQAIATYKQTFSGSIVAERNYGGEMVESTIHSVDEHANVKLVTASRGKAVRAEPIAALYEQGKVVHVGRFPELEAELVGFDPANVRKSPNRMDALVWAMTSLVDKEDGVLAYYRQMKVDAADKKGKNGKA